MEKSEEKQVCSSLKGFAWLHKKERFKFFTKQTSEMSYM